MNNRPLVESLQEELVKQMRENKKLKRELSKKKANKELKFKPKVFEFDFQELRIMRS